LTGEILEVKGKINVEVQYKDKEVIYNLVLIVVNSEKYFIPLLGRNWLNILFPGWQNFLKSYSSLNYVKVTT